MFFKRFFNSLFIIILILLSAAPAMAFDDLDPDHWAYRAVEFLADHGLVEGFPDGLFHGDNSLTRYEFAMVVARLYENFTELIENENPDDDPDINIEVVLDSLLAEFQPELDELRQLIAENTSRIENLESETSEIQTSIDDVKSAIQKMNNRFSPFADLRLRFEGFYPETGLDTQRAEHRLRFGFNSKITDELTLSARFASGSPGAINNTEEFYEDSFALDPFNVDRAFLQWTPSQYKGFSLWAGRFNPPWVATQFVWDADVNVEGLAQRFSDGDASLYLAELVPAQEGFYLVAQGAMKNIFADGLDAAVTYHFMTDDAWKYIMNDMKSGKLRSHFIFDRLDNPTDYRAIEAYLAINGKINSTPYKIVLNAFKNLADGIPGGDDPWTDAGWASFTYGSYPTNVGDWQFIGEIGKAEANTMLSFISLVGSDRKWWTVYWDYRLTENTNFAICYFTVDKISIQKGGYDLIQIDVYTKI